MGYFFTQCLVRFLVSYCNKGIVLLFDLEFYVPPHERELSNVSLIMNPARENHIILGGTFVTFSPKQKGLKFIDFWIWEQEQFENSLLDAEKELLRKIYDFIDTFAIEMWEHREKYRKKRGWKNPAKKKIEYVGIGIARTDLPILYVRSSFHKIAPNPDLFELYLAHHPFDLANAAFGYISPNNLSPVLAREIFSHFGVEYEKDSSKSVWQLFDENNYDPIKLRTHHEIIATAEVLQKIIKKHRGKH